MNNPIHIGSHRELLWDDYLVDTERSTTVAKLHQPVQRECVITLDHPLKFNSAFNFVMQDGDLYRMYTPQGPRCVYSESTDGIHWYQPALDEVKVEGYEHNSFLPIEYLPGYSGLEGFRVFKDEHPDCKPEERYKAVSTVNHRIQCFASPDGIHFKQLGPLSITGINQGSPFDSINTVFYDKYTGKYKAYVRDYSSPSNPEDGTWIRSVSLTESENLFPKDKDAWPKPKFLRYDTPNNWQMYINSILPYYRADHVYVGFPSRYVIRTEWTDNYDELCGREDRLRRAGPERNHRLGLSVSDTLFMCSRDGLHWTRYPDAFVRPGPEHPYNWLYGSVYFSNGIVETKSAHPGCDNEISFYCMENRFFDKEIAPQIYRYSIRLDGFASQSSVYPESNLYTKPFIFEGKDLFINFATSAYGYMKFTLTDEDGNSISSCQTFGDSTDRRVRFQGDLAAFAGKPVTMSVNMVDADFYSFIFR